MAKLWAMPFSALGRPLTFKPKELWEKSCEYFQWCDDNPLMSYEWNGKDPVKCELEKLRPYTLKGLCLYLGVNEAYFRQFDTDTHKDFSTVITRIRDTIYNQKFEGAAAGLLNPNIIARDLGLVDKSESKNTGEGIKILLGQNKGEDTSGIETTVHE